MLPRECPKRTSSSSIYESKSQDASPEVFMSSVCSGIVSKGRRAELAGIINSEDDITLAFQEPCSFLSSISLTPSRPRPIDRGMEGQPRPSISPFPNSHRALLTLIAAIATRSTDSPIARSLLEGIFTTFVAVSAVTEDRRSTDVDKGDRQGMDRDVPVTGDVPFYTCYPELKALHEVNNVRKILYSLQTSPPHARLIFYNLLEYHIRGLHEILPDPLFEAFIAVLNSALKHHTSFLTKSRMHLFEMQLLETVAAVQMELLKQTKMLTERATIITLCFKHTSSNVSQPF
ncbi:unnamed protein product [Phytomonas sp. Hart1]|nr:unnamed protein product [Phytomonas sp. Hart1]|eukprot:CCW68148.1 unnamed protein product [Phytomonas sp. isolate Hart1]